MGRATDQPLLGLEARDTFRIEPVDQALHLRHHFGADAVAGEKQELVGRHGCFLVYSRGVLERGARIGKQVRRRCMTGNTPSSLAWLRPRGSSSKEKRAV